MSLISSLGALTVALLAATAATVGMLDTKVLIVTLAAVFGGAGILLSGNVRLSMLYALLFLAPFNIKKNFVSVGHMAGATSFDFHVSDPFLLALVFYLLQDFWLHRGRSFRFPPALLLWLALMVGGSISIFFNSMPLPPAHEVFRMARWLLWMLVIVNEVVKRKQFLHVAYAMLIAASAQTLVAYLEVFGVSLGLEAYGQMTEQEIRNLGSATLRGDSLVHRIGGIMVHPNILGAYLAFNSSIALSLLFTPIGWTKKILISGLLASFVPIIVLTLSRAAWIDFALVIFLVTVLTNANPYSRLRFTVLRTAILTGIVILAVGFSGPIVTRLTRSDPSAVDTRWEFVVTAFTMVSERPLLGWGLNTTTFYQPEFTRQGSVNAMMDYYGMPGQWPVVHNSYLLVWVEQGTIGLLIWLSFHGSVILAALGNLRTRDPTLHALNVGFLAAYSAFLVDGLVSFFDRLQQGVIIWALAALIFAIAYWRRANESARVLGPKPPETENSPAYSGGRISRPSGFIQESPTSLWQPQTSELS